MLVAGEKSCRDGEGIVFAQDGVGGSDGGFGYGNGVVHVSEIDDAGDAEGLRIDESVVVVGVTVDDAAAKMGKARDGFLFEKIQEMFG